MSLRRLLPAAALALAAFALPAQAPAAVSPFSARFTTNAAGDISIIGNTSLTCPASASCATAQAGGADQNNNFAMGYVDVDSDAATFDSSSATLTLPVDGRVMFAGLYWGGRSSAGSGGGAAAAPSAASRASVRLKVPGSATYATITGAETGSYSSSGEDAYQAFADVTSQVQAAGPGAYTVANVQLGKGQNTYGGWTLVVAYRDDAAPPRNLAVFDGFQVLRNGGGDSSKTITVSGMQAPPGGAVTARVGVVAYDGDRGLTGDVLKLNGTSLSDALHPVNDVFNSTIGDLGVADPGRSPSYANLLGIDASIFGADGLIPNGATSASIALTTGGETYFPGVVTSSIDLYAPHVEVTKSVTDLNGGDVAIGDTLEYSVQVHNSGGDSAADVVVNDAVPTHTTYVPGSLAISSGTGAGALTDAAGDDRGDVTAGVVHARLGTGATPSSGGTLAVGSTSVVTFRVQVDGGLANGTSIVNQAEVPHVASILGSPLLARSATVTSTVVVPPVSTPDPGPAPPDPTPPSPPAPDPTPPSPPAPDPTPPPAPDPTPPAPDPTPVPAPAPLPDQPVTPAPAPPAPVPDPGPALPPAAPVRPPAKTPSSPMIAMGVSGPRTVRQGESARYTVVVRSTGDSAASRVQVTVPVPAGMTVARMPAGSRLVRGVVVMPARTMGRGSRRSVALWFRATGSTATVTLAPTVTASGLHALHGRAPTRVTRPVDETLPAVAG